MCDLEIGLEEMRKITLHVDAGPLKTLAPRLRPSWRYKASDGKEKSLLYKPAGTWWIDHCSERVPWSAEFLAHLSAASSLSEASTLPTKDQVITLTRLAVVGAWTAGHEALARQRSDREPAHTVRHGLPEDVPGVPEALVNSVVELSGRLDDPASCPPLLAAAMFSEKLGVDAGVIHRLLNGEPVSETEIRAWQAEIRGNAAGRPGDRAAHELQAFIVHLGTWWWRVTGRRPESQRKGTEREDLRRRRRFTFIDFATAALADATGKGTGEAKQAARIIRTALQNAEKNPHRPALWIRDIERITSTFGFS